MSELVICPFSVLGPGTYCHEGHPSGEYGPGLHRCGAWECTPITVTQRYGNTTIEKDTGEIICQCVRLKHG